MWAWGLAERAAAGLLGPAGANGGRWSTAVAVGVTAAAGIALVAIVVSSRSSPPPDPPFPYCEGRSFAWPSPLVADACSGCRGGIKSPWRRRRRKPALASKEWRSLFTLEGKFHDGGVKLLKRVRNGGIEPSIRAEVWPFLLGVIFQRVGRRQASCDLPTFALDKAPPTSIRSVKLILQFWLNFINEETIMNILVVRMIRSSLACTIKLQPDSSEAEREAVKAQNRKGYLLLRKHCLRKNNEESKRSSETAGANHEELICSGKVKESVSPVGSEEPEKPSVEEHITHEEENSCVILKQEMQDETAQAILENQTDTNLCSSISRDDHESEKSDVTDVEASRNDVASVHQSSTEDEQESMPRYSNAGGNMELENELSKAARPVKSARTIEDFDTWQRIIRLDAVRANDEWVSYSPSQAEVSREKAIESAQAVCLKDYEHLESHRIHHASRLVAILEAYATYDPEIGYCQGMSDLLAPLLAVLEDDDEAFWCFAGFMRKPATTSGLMKWVFAGNSTWCPRIIKNKDFRLYRHLEMLEAADCFFVYRMVVVMFRRELTFDQTLSLWEVMWADQAASRAGIATSSWGKLRLAAPPTDDLLLYAIAASVLEKRKLIIESYSSMDEIIRDCNSMAGQLDIWKLLDDAHDLVVTLHDRIE